MYSFLPGQWVQSQYLIKPFKIPKDIGIVIFTTRIECFVVFSNVIGMFPIGMFKTKNYNKLR